MSVLSYRNKIQSIAIPNFGSGYPTNSMDARPFMHPDRTSEVIADEQRGSFQKMADFIENLFSKDTMPNVENMQDIYGNDIIIAKDSDGDQYLASSLKNLDESKVFAPFIQKYGKENVAEAINQTMLKQYIEEKYPSFGTRLRIYEGGRGHTIHDTDIAANSHIYYVNPLTADVNKNGIPDYLESGLNTTEAMADKNHNHIPDILEQDLNGNGIKDYWEVDANNNHIPDIIENVIKNLFD